MEISILARDTDTVVDRCSGSCDGLCPRTAAGEPVFCAGLRLRSAAPAGTTATGAGRSWVWAISETATSCPVSTTGRHALAV